MGWINDKGTNSAPQFQKGGKVKSSSKYSMKELVDLSKKHNKTVEEIKKIIDAGPKGPKGGKRIL